MAKKTNIQKRISNVKSEPIILLKYSPDKKISVLVYAAIIAITILLPILIVAGAYGKNGYFGFPLDDPWIHLTFAKNLAKYFSFSYFKNEMVTAGSTSPIYTALLSVGFFISNNEFILSYFLGILFLAASGIFFYKLSSFDFNKENIFAIFCTAIFISDKWMNFISVSGMETTMYIFILIACAYFYKKKKSIPFAIFAGLIIWTRPDGVAFYAALIVDYLWLLFTSKSDKSLKLFSKKDYIKIATIFSAMLLLYFALNIMLSSSLLPNTYTAKLTYYSPEFKSRSEFLKNEVWNYFTNGSYGIIMAGFIIAVLIMLKDVFKKNYNRTILYIGFIVALIFEYWYKLPYAHRFGRYMMPVIPFFILASALGYRDIFYAIGKYMKGKAVYQVLSVIIFGAMLILNAINFKPTSVSYSEECKYINDRQVTAAIWLRDNTKPEDIIATHDVGAIGFYSERKIVDIAGLITPELINKINTKDYGNFLSDYLKEKNVSYLAILREWYRISNDNSLMSTFGKLPPEIMEIYRFVPGKTLILSNEMKSMLMYIEELAARGGQQNLQQAKQLIQRAEKMEPNAAVIPYISALIYAKTGDPKAEESELLKALQIFPEYRDAMKLLIYMYAQTSRTDEAKNYLDKYKMIFPNDEDGLKLEKYISDVRTKN
jgi:tetratricopeptide (TPR) repeat protein